jgi:hypothetical protein
MPVIINDFQITVEPPAQPQTRGGGGEAEQPPPPPPKMMPDEINAVSRVNRERMERVRAD